MVQIAELVNESTTNLGQVRTPESSTPLLASGKGVSNNKLAPGNRDDSGDPDPTHDVTKINRDAVADKADVVKPLQSSLPSSRSSPPKSIGHPVPGKIIGKEDGNRRELPVILNSNLTNVAGLVAGDVVADRYVVVDVLPGSGMGQIYKALDRYRDSTDAPSSYVALKFMRIRANGEGDSASDIRREFDTLSQLSHPNIVKAFDIGVRNDVEFMVLEWLDGTTLLHLLEAQSCKRIALSRARAILRSAAAGLACAHEKNIVHGDVKPSNIFVTNRGTVKLLDFGAIYEKRDGEVLQSWATRAYASSDVLSGSAATKADDVYSLGVTAYLLLSGERPFGTKDAIEARREDFPLRPLPPDSSDHWPAVSSALNFDKSERPADAARFLAEFLQLPPTGAPPEVRTQVSFPYYLAVAALVVYLGLAWGVRLNGLSPIDTRATLLRADKALAEGRLTEPEGDNAHDLYRAVLVASPESSDAKSGLHGIASQFLLRASNALAADDFDSARANLSAARQVSPEHSSIPIVERLFDRHATDLVVSAQLIASRDPVAANSILERVEEFTDSEAERIAAIRSRIAEDALDLELRTLLAGIDERILAERLAVPPGDSAIDLLRKARELKPDDDRLPLAANRIVSALLFEALFAISEGQLDKAAGFIDNAQSLEVQHLATAQTAYELAKARDRVAEEVYRRAMSAPANGDTEVSAEKIEPQEPPAATR